MTDKVKNNEYVEMFNVGENDRSKGVFIIIIDFGDK